jgi:membrane protein implicated in regulation of membrane protease activity
MTRPTLAVTLAALALAAVLGWLLTLSWWLAVAATALASGACLVLGAFEEDNQPHPPDPAREQRRKVHLALGQMRRRYKRTVNAEDGA